MVVMISSEEYKELAIKAHKYDELQKPNINTAENKTKKIKNTKFKEGDVVTLINVGLCTSGFQERDICEVTSIQSNVEMYPIEILRLRDIKDKCYGYVYENQIEKVEEE